MMTGNGKPLSIRRARNAVKREPYMQPGLTRASWRQLTVVAAVLVAALSACEAGPSAPGGPVGDVAIDLIPKRSFYPVGDTARAILRGAGASAPRAWRSLTPDIVRIASTGLVSMIGRGTARIEAEVDGHTIQLEFVVQGVLRNQAIDTSTTWHAADSPHVVEGPLLVGAPNGVVLTVEPGATVLFRPRSWLRFGEIHPARLVIPAGGAPVVMAGDSAVRGSWMGLRFDGPGVSELRNVTLRHCGTTPSGSDMGGCIVGRNIPRGAPTFLIEGLTVTEAVTLGLNLENFVTIAPGSRDLTIEDVEGRAALVSPMVAGTLPANVTIRNNTDDDISVRAGLVDRSITWSDPGVPLRLTGTIEVRGEAEVATLTMSPGLRVRAEPHAGIKVGLFGAGGLIAGATSGPPVVLQSTGSGWRGIEIFEGARPRSLTNVQLVDCGDSGACITVFPNVEYDTRLRVEQVTITGSRSIGVQLWAGAPFADGSTGLTVTGAADVPIELSADAAVSLPASSTYHANAVDGIRLRSGLVTQSATWRDVGVPYIAVDGLSIGNPDLDPVLTLEPGVTIRVAGERMIAVAPLHWPGALRAVGTAEQPIVLTSMGTAVPGAWIGLELGRSADARTRLDHVHIEAAGAGEPGVGAAVRMWVDPGGVLRNMTIRASANCAIVWFDGTEPAEDYLLPALGNAFVDVAGPLLCRL